jgi:hypothetical protein
VKVHATLARRLSDRLDRLHDARLVVGEHHRDEFRVRTHRGDDRVRRDLPAPRRRDPRHFRPATLELAKRFGDRWMLDGGCDDVGTTGRRHGAEDGRVVRLGSAAGEHDLPRGRADERRDRLAGVLEDSPGGLAFPMNGRRIAVDVPQSLFEDFEDARMNRRRRVIVQIDPHQPGKP